MRVGFLLNQIDNRGTGNAVFDYAHYNEEVLKNSSFIFTMDTSPRDGEMEKRFLSRFGDICSYWSEDVAPIDVLYHIKSGEFENLYPVFDSDYVVHAVFNASQPHGDQYAAISQWLGDKNGVPWVPHIVSLPSASHNFRSTLGIPTTATVFGRHGGYDTFDIAFAWDAINNALSKKEDVWFVFLNTQKPNKTFFDPRRVIFLPLTVDPHEKRGFINTCDIMLHARSRGETFGIAVGEFAICDKPVITYGKSPEQAHLQELGAYYVYNNKEQLVAALTRDWDHEGDLFTYARYKKWAPENVMKKFKEVFLD